MLLYPTSVALLLGLTGRLNWRWTLLVTIAMVAVQYSVRSGISRTTVPTPRALPPIAVLAGYAAYQGAIVWAFTRVRVRGKSKSALFAALVAALLPLVLAKLKGIAAPLSLTGVTAGFLGISYVTFRALDVLLGVHDALITGLTPARYVAFLFFFPTISAGPIDRYRRFTADFERQRNRGEFLADLDAAVPRLFRGLLYKFLLAAVVKQYWMDRVPGGGFAATVSYMYAYSLYLFFDFAGYSAFAIALSYLFGIRTPENFDRPFLAPNIGEFWNRWHISLSTWFRDNVYMRLVLAATKGKWFRDRLLASAVGFVVTFGLMGVWHGLRPHYLAYGLYHGVLMSSYQLVSRWGKRRPWWGKGAYWRPVSILLTAHVVCFGFLIFSGRLGD